jgi:hypothetical protein
MKKVTVSKIVVLIIICSFTYALGKDALRRISVSSCSKITIATPKTIARGYKSGRTLTYEYRINGKTYNGSTGVDNWLGPQNDDHYFMTKRYFVKVSCVFPSLSILEEERAVPATMITTPDEGWDTIPE